MTIRKQANLILVVSNFEYKDNKVIKHKTCRNIIKAKKHLHGCFLVCDGVWSEI